MPEQRTNGRNFGGLVSVLAMLVIAALMWAVLHRSMLGRALQLVGRIEGVTHHRRCRSGYPVLVELCRDRTSESVGRLADARHSKYRASLRV